MRTKQPTKHDNATHRLLNGLNGWIAPANDTIDASANTKTTKEFPSKPLYTLTIQCREPNMDNVFARRLAGDALRQMNSQGATSVHAFEGVRRAFARINPVEQLLGKGELRAKISTCIKG